MKKTVVLLAAVLLTVPAMAGCGGSPSTDRRPDEGGKGYRLKDESPAFGLGLFAQVASADHGSNIVLSPLSAKLALAMAYNGAVGETKEGMASVLDLEGMGLEEVNEQLGNLMTSLERADEDVLLEIANSLWANRDYELSREFVRRCRDSYEAEVANLDFADAGSPQRINAWVKEKTREKIEKIVDRLSPELALILVNAVYFNGKWHTPFDASLTQDGDFHLLDGGTATVPLMDGWDDYSYYEDDEVQAVDLPYGEGRMSMYVILPREGQDYAEFLGGLDEDKWGAWMGGFSTSQGRLILPRFRVEYAKELSDALKAMGMERAFREGLDDMFAARAGEAFIGKVMQKTFIDVNEEGTEAAAVTGVEVEMTAAPISEPFTMRVDRPFFFAIRDNQTGALLFLGSIVDPS